MLKYILKLYYQYLLEKRVKKACILSKLEGRRYIVTAFFGKPICISKQQLTQLLKRKKFKKGTTIQKIESTAYFVTNLPYNHVSKH